MNILFVCIGYGGVYFGNFMASLCALADKTEEKGGNSVFLFSGNVKKADWIADMHKSGYKIYFARNSKLEEYRLLKSICKKYKIDIIYHHFWQLREIMTGKAIRRQISGKRIRTVIHWHNAYHVSESKLKEKIKRQMLDADLHIGCGRDVTSDLLNAGYGNAICIDNCIEWKRLDNYRQINLGGKGTLKLLTFSSYGFEAKGIDISIKAVEKAREIYPNIELVVAVSADLEKNTELIKKECGKKIPPWIYIVPTVSDVATYYHAVDAYINSSRTEGLCYATIEAIYCDCRIIQSNCHGNRVDVPATYIYNVGNVYECAKTIIELYEESSESKSDKKRIAKDYVLKKYNIDTWVSKETEALESLLM